MATSPKPRLGFHYFPDEAHYTTADLQVWLPRLQASGAAWLVVRAGLGQLIPEAFLRGVIEAGLRPVVWIHAPIGALRAKDLAPALNTYHRWGVQYVVPGDRPNLRQSWPASEWSRSGLVERCVDRLLPLLQLQRSIGLRPVFPPLEPGGDYWDTAFLETAVRSLMRRGQHDLVRELSLAVYGWTYGRALDWGAGGPERWPESRPYAAPETSPDQRGIRLSEWYDAVLTRAFGQTLPLLVVAGGALRGPLGRGFQEDYAAQSASLLRLMTGPDAPASIQCFAFYPLATSPADPEAPFAWFDTAGQPRLATVGEILRSEPDTLSPHRAGTAAKTPAAAPSSARAAAQPVDRPLEHYVLLAESSAAALARGLQQLGGMAMEQRAVVGFSSEQARLAKRVTILGSEQAIPAWIEHGLRQHGCQVTRVRIDDHAGAGSGSGPTPYPRQD
jgi:hypothetical protein